LALRLALLQELNFRSLLILDEPTYGVDDENLPQLANQLGLAAKQLSQTIIVTHHGICEEDATNMLIVRVGEDGVSRIEPTR
jgi:DNA repair exonuclease SbcCD ATPase subunit